MVKVANTKPVDDVATEDAALSIVGFSVVCALVAATGDSVGAEVGSFSTDMDMTGSRTLEIRSTL